MKKILGLVVVLVALASGMSAVAQVTGLTFGAGNIVIYRVGDGTAPVTNAGQAVFLDEYTPASIAAVTGTFSSPIPVQSIMMPTNWYGGNAPLIADGNAQAEGQLVRSVDGRYLVMAGYGATLSFAGTPSYQVTNGSLSSATVTGVVNQVGRVVGLVDGFGHIFTTTVQTNLNEEGDDPRCAASLNGTNIWMGGSSRGTKYLTRGSGVSTQVCALLSINRAINIYSNTLYTDDSHDFIGATNKSASVNLITGTALPTSFTATNFVNLPGVYGSGGGSAFGFAMFNLTGGANIDTIYVADSLTNCPGEPLRRGGGVMKFYYNGSSWVNAGRICAEGVTWVTGVQNGQNVTLYMTEGGGTNAVDILYAYQDTSGFGNDPGSLPDLGDANAYSVPLYGYINSALVNTRGIAFAPVGGEAGTLSGAAALTVGPPYGGYFSGPFGGPFTPGSYTYSVANLSTATANFAVSFLPVNGGAWLQASPASGTLAPGASTTVNVSLSGVANTDSGGTRYQSKVLFKSGSVGGTTNTTFATPLTTLDIFAFFVTPTSNFISTADQPGGPFTPSSYVYAITNATPGPLGWSAFTSNNWTTVSPTSGTIDGHAVSNVTVSINANANSLPIGNYNDVLILTNTSVVPPTQFASRGITAQVGFGIFDDFSTYVDGNVVGQNNWRSGANTDNPVQIKSGQYVVPGGCPENTAQQPYKYVAAQQVTNPASYSIFGMSITFTNGSTAPNYTFTIGTTFLTTDDAGIVDAGGGHYKWSTQINAFQTSGADVGTLTYDYGTPYLVFLVTDNLNSNAWVFVNPGTADFNALTNQAPAVHSTGGNCGYCAGDSPGFNSIGCGQFSACANNEQQQGYFITKLAASTNYANVYNFLVGAVGPSDPFTIWQNTYFSAGQLANPSISGPNADPDHDGVSNTNEFLAGFNPTNAAAYPHIISIAKAPGGMNVTYLGANGDNTWSPGWVSRTNVLEFSTGVPGTGVYSNNFASTGQTNILSGGNGSGQITNMVDPNGLSGTTRYYRIRVIAP